MAVNKRLSGLFVMHPGGPQCLLRKRHMGLQHQQTLAEVLNWQLRLIRVLRSQLLGFGERSALVTRGIASQEGLPLTQQGA